MGLTMGETRKMSRASRGIRRILVDLRLWSDIDKPLYVERTYAGWIQRADGWVSWIAVDGDGYTICGSQDACRDLTKAHRQGHVTYYRYRRTNELELIIEEPEARTLLAETGGDNGQR